MRLVCPNCGAQYEVPNGVIPDEGRDVQCSNCGHTWFEPHPDAVAASVETPPPPPPQPAQTEPTARPAPQQQGVDPAVADVLRREAEYEAQARAAERAGGLETQPDLGLDDGSDATAEAKRQREAEARMAQRRGPTAVEAPAPPPPPAAPEGTSAAVAATVAAAESARPRRDQLPDIEDINASLRSSKEPRLTDRGEPPPHIQVAQADRRRFRRSFFLVVLFVALLVALYVFAPQISDAVPQLKAPLDQYVAIIDAGRAWLNTQVDAGLKWLDSMASEASPPATDAPADGTTAPSDQ